VHDKYLELCVRIPGAIETIASNTPGIVRENTWRILCAWPTLSLVQLGSKAVVVRSNCHNGAIQKHAEACCKSTVQKHTVKVLQPCKIYRLQNKACSVGLIGNDKAVDTINEADCADQTSHTRLSWHQTS
jgi:polyferredoxin